MDRTLVSVVAPVYNEAAVVRELLGRLGAAADGLADRHDFEFVLADDGSEDGTIEVLTGLIEAEPRLRVVQLRRNYGQTQALQAGLDHARGEIIVTLDADLQTLPEEIPALLAKLDEGYDLVCGRRVRRVEGVVRRLTSRAGNALLRAASGLAIRDFGNTFRAFRRELATDLVLLGEAHRYFPVWCDHLGARIAEVPVSQVERPSGRSNYGLSRTLGVMTDLVLIHLMRRYRDRPMRAFGHLGWPLFGLGLVLLIVGAIQALAAGSPGWLILGGLLIVLAAWSFLLGFAAELVVRARFRAERDRVYRVRRVLKKQPDQATTTTELTGGEEGGDRL